tara:strand:+ start:6282 stop:7847 length:1566 start_codon:yes stop_codon:yes gene_type:complete
MPIFDKKSYLNTSILYKGHIHKIEQFAVKYKKNKLPIVLKRSNDDAMTLRNTIQYKQRCTEIYNPFDDIIQLNTKKRTVHVGAMITMGKLMNYLYPLGYALSVVPEFKSLTVGGLISGSGLESSSVHYGLFPLQCIEYTVVLGNGEIKKVTEKTEPELFSAIPLSYGTLCMILDVVMTIIPVKPNIKLECVCIKDYSIVQNELDKILKQSEEYDFIEGIIYSKTKTVIIKGVFTDTLLYPVIHPVTWYDPYFYQEIEKNVDECKYECTMNLLDYYFRHDRGSFWIFKHIIGDNKLCRTLNPFINHASDKNIIMQPLLKGILNYKNIEIQDTIVPLSKVQSILDFVDINYSIYPIWLCPCRNIDTSLNQKQMLYNLLKNGDIKELIQYIKSNKEFFNEDKIDVLLLKLSATIHMDESIEMIIDELQIKTSLLGILQLPSLEDFYVDIGIYGCSSKSHNKDKLLALLENITNKNEGFMGQYIVTPNTRDNFDKNILKKHWYMYMRKKYHAVGSYPNIYDKLCK